MYGAIIGDVVGSRFEFDRGGKTKDFELFTPDCTFTDDTVMTVAVADVLTSGYAFNCYDMKEALKVAMRLWANKYPNRGYGAKFVRWLFGGTQEQKPYNSFGNGSAMRVSSVGWRYETIEETREAARATAEISHNHPEGIKGAECTAAVIFLGSTGHTKDQIKEYVINEFGYDFSETLEEMRKRHEHIETCMDSMPKALRAFFDGESYEDVIRNAVSLGGDTDTLGAIAGAMAEGFYEIPEELIIKCRKYLPDDMINVVERFYKWH